MKDASKLIHRGRKSDENFGCVNPPIYQSSTILFPNMQSYDAAEAGQAYYKSLYEGESTDPAYGISGSETSNALRDALKSLENAADCFITNSGLSAITLTLNAFLKAGDHLLMVDTVYGPTRRFCNRVLKRFGVEVEYYNPTIGADIEGLIRENTRMIFLESPGSFTFEVQDIGTIAEIAKRHDIITAIDNSWATPMYLKPLDLGINISIHAITKYINGHSDILQGAILCDEACRMPLVRAYKDFGVCSSPFASYQSLRGLRTLNARLKAQSEALQKVFVFMENNKKVKRILAPAHLSHETYDMWRKYYHGTTNLFSIEFKESYDYEKLCSFINSLKLFGIGASWGGFESLVKSFSLDSVRSVTHEASKSKYSGSLVRFYIGLEDADDIISDLEDAFAIL